MAGGGILICTPYYESILFKKNGSIELKRKLIEPFQQSDIDPEIVDESGYFFQETGRYEVNGRNYIECDFKTYLATGLPLKINTTILVFNFYTKKLNFSGQGVAYQLKNS